MEIIINRVKDYTIESFADRYSLVMEVNERTDPSTEGGRWYASFIGCDVKRGNILISNVGNGSTPEKAIKQYTKNISLQNIVINAYKPTRKTITVPKLIQKD